MKSNLWTSGMSFMNRRREVGACTPNRTLRAILTFPRLSSRWKRTTAGREGSHARSIVLRQVI